jgi:formaldehyde-activating enzyme involved in methanogenesis
MIIINNSIHVTNDNKQEIYNNTNTCYITIILFINLINNIIISLI